MKQKKIKQVNSILILISLVILTNCNKFEKNFYASIDQAQINAIKNGFDIFDLSKITDFEWDSVMLIRGNESVPVFKEQIEETLNNRTSEIHWENRRFKGEKEQKFLYKTTDLPICRDRFYFLTSEKKIIEKEIKSGINKHNPEYHLKYCLIDTINERYWLSKKECKFTVKSNVRTAGQGAVFLYPNCDTKFSSDSLINH